MVVYIYAVYLVDIWNVIEAFRESGLGSLDCADEVPLNVVEVLLSSLFCALNKRLPNSAQIDVSESVLSLFSFLVCAYDVYALLHCLYRSHTVDYNCVELQPNQRCIVMDAGLRIYPH